MPIYLLPKSNQAYTKSLSNKVTYSLLQPDTHAKCIHNAKTPNKVNTWKWPIC